MGDKIYKIAYIEDEILLRKSLSYLLIAKYSKNIICETYNNAEDFLKNSKDGLDFIITDDELGKGIKGSDLAKKLKKEHITIPIMLISGSADEKGYCDELIKKPFSAPDLFFIIEKYLPELKNNQ